MIGWLMCVLCWIGYIKLHESILLVAAGMFAIAGAIDQGAYKIKECINSGIDKILKK